MKEKIAYYTAEEIAKVLRLHPYTIRRLCREKKVPAFKFGGQWRFRKDEIEVWSRSKRSSLTARAKTGKMKRVSILI